MKRLKNFFINTIILVLTTFFLRILAIFFNSYLSQKIGSEAIGLFSLIMSVYLFAITLATSGISLATTRIVAEELALGNMKQANKAAQKAICISFLCSCFISLLLFFSSHIIVHTCFHDKVNVYVIYLICVALPFIAMSSVINGYFTGIRKTYKSATSQFVEQISKILACMIILFISSPSNLDYICSVLIIGDVLSEIISFLYLAILYYFEKKNLFFNKFSRHYEKESHIKKIFKISLPITFTSCIRSGLSTIKQILLPISLEKSGMDCTLALSKYGKISGMAMPIILFFSFIIQSFGSLLVPEFTRYHTKNDKKRARQVSSFILIFTFLISLLFAFIVFYFAPNLSLFIYKDIEVGFYIRILSPLIIFIYLDTVVDYILKGLNQQVAVMFINIADLVVSIIILYFFVPILGVNGYILSLYISEILNFSLSIIKLRLIV